MPTLAGQFVEVFGKYGPEGLAFGFLIALLGASWFAIWQLWKRTNGLQDELIAAALASNESTKSILETSIEARLKLTEGFQALVQSDVEQKRYISELGADIKRLCGR